jgi:AsmA protein
MKRLLWVIGGLCTVVLLFVLLFPVVVDLESLKARWLPVAEQALGRRLTVGHIRLSWYPIGVTVRDIAVMDDPAFGAAPFFSADAVTVRPAIWPLLHSEIDIATLTVARPVVTLIKRADGRWNVQSLGSAAVPDHTVRPGRGSASTGVPPVPPVFDRVRFINGTVIVHDQRAGASPMLTDRINLSVDHVRLGETVTFNGSAHVGNWPAPIALSGRIRVAAAGPAIEEADLRIGLGRSDLHAVIHPDRSGSAVRGTLPSSEPGSGWGIHLDSKRIDVDELTAGGERAGAPGTAYAAVPPAGRPASGLPLTAGAAPWPGSVAIEMTVGELRLHQQTFKALRASGRMRGGAAHLETLTANTAGGTVDAKGTIDLSRPDRPFTGNVGLSAIDLESLQRAWSTSATWMTGTATVAASMTGALGSSLNWQELVKTVHGTARVDVRDGAILGIDLSGTVTDQLRKLIGRKASHTAGPARTPFSTATAEAALRQGIASIGSFQLESNDFSLSASGRMELTPPRPVDLKAEMRLSKPISQQFDKTALTLLSVQGRLAIPVLIRGTTTDPKVLPDVKLLNKRTRGRLSKRVLDEVMSDQVDQLQQAGKSLLKELLGR